MGGTWTSDRGQRNKSTTFLGLAVKVGLLLFRKQASGKKGAERKAFMKTCLSTKKA